jgi:hypothetical protein
MSLTTSSGIRRSPDLETELVYDLGHIAGCLQVRGTLELRRQKKLAILALKQDLVEPGSEEVAVPVHWACEIEQKDLVSRTRLKTLGCIAEVKGTNLETSYRI